MIPVSRPSGGDSQSESRIPGAWDFVIGSYTEPYGAFRAVGDGVSLVRLGADGSLSLQDQLRLPNPSYLRPGKDGLIRAVLETNDDRSAVATLAVRDGRLTLLQTVAVAGRIPCHIDIHPDAKWLAVACYGSGDVLTWGLDAAGLIRIDSGSRALRSGSSIHPIRQTTSHPHAVRFSPDGNWIIVPDLGTDEVASYRFHPEAGLAAQPEQIWRPQPGSGPRLPLFSRDGRIVLLVSELTSRLTSLAWDDGAMREIDSISTLPAAFSGDNTAAGLRLHPSGGLVGVTNRGAHCVSLFNLDQRTGKLSLWQAVPSGGIKPRDFAFSPCGRWLLVTNQDSDCLVLYSIDLTTARLEDTGQRLHIRSPSVAKVL
jgi:6-phosphogluconolactonase